MDTWLDFVNFQMSQHGVVCAEDAAAIAKTTRASIYEWGKRRCVKTFIHRGKVYIGLDSLREFVSLRPLVLGDERIRRRRLYEKFRLKTNKR